jgi:uncharacterized membrane protein HdeD (DUF308 family)
MADHLSLNWWAIALRGVVAILFGLLAFALPGLTLATLILLFGAFALVDGASSLITGIRRPAGGPDWLMVLGGAAGIAAGIVAFVNPGLTALVLLTLIGAWAIVTGIAEIVAAWRLREAIRGELLLALNGIVSVLFGLYIWVFPGAGAIALVWVIAVYAIVSGVVLLMLAFRMRGRAAAGLGPRVGSTG